MNEVQLSYFQRHQASGFALKQNNESLRPVLQHSAGLSAMTFSPGFFDQHVVGQITSLKVFHYRNLLSSWNQVWLYQIH